MAVHLIAAISKNNCIGIQGRLPWHLPEDTQHFKRLTMGSVVMMGRKTWESIPERFRPLSGRKNVVITRQTAYDVPSGTETFHALSDALEAHASHDIWIIGGTELYRAALPLADRLHITHVDQDVAGDAFFPMIDLELWKEIEREDHEGFSFVTYART